MADFIEKLPKGLPKLPENYWGTKSDASNPEEINIFDKNLKASVDDISIFKNKK